MINQIFLSKQYHYTEIKLFNFSYFLVQNLRQKMCYDFGSFRLQGVMWRWRKLTAGNLTILVSNLYVFVCGGDTAN